ncbi:pilus assembly protein [Chthonobacter rhizosphaerae]|uniref:pilus assembly protein n=1 Tax=Chthonobacter rhizosphaerae TaxID=2735553 RepID=UPI0015EE71CF|nr:pilus assembly protein [Chthonobacter rhizosphaerae]
MPGPRSTCTDRPPSGLIGALRRLHGDDRGLASMEFVLAAPVLLLLVVFLKHANLISLKRMDTVTEIRSAAFAEAHGLFCTTDFERLVPMPQILPDPLPAGWGPERLTCSSRQSHQGGGSPKRTFVWDDLKKIAKDKNASSDITRDQRSQKPMLVTAKATRIYRYADGALIRSNRWGDEFTVGDSTLFASTNDVTRRGWDKVLRQEIRGVASKSGDLFDGVFPGAK